MCSLILRLVRPILIHMSELFNPKPTRLFVPPASELSNNRRHFKPYSLPPGKRLEKLKGTKGLRIPGDEVLATFIVYEALKNAETEAEAAELGQFFAAAAYGGCKYLLNTPARRAGSTLRHAKARQTTYSPWPMLATPDRSKRPGTEELRDRALHATYNAIAPFMYRSAARTYRGKSTELLKADRQAGVTLRRVAGALAVIGSGDFVADRSNGISDDEAQLIARDDCIRAMQAAEDTGIETGVHSSFIQLVSAKAPFSVELQRAASPEAEKHYLAAQAQYAA